MLRAFFCSSFGILVGHFESPCLCHLDSANRIPVLSGQHAALGFRVQSFRLKGLAFQVEVLGTGPGFIIPAYKFQGLG